MPNKKININNGVVLDPFAIHMTGLMRRHNGIKSGIPPSDFFAPLHGEEKFKQSFVNACHFAEQMTVVGPIAQVAWDMDQTNPITQALYWKAKAIHAGNEKLLNHITNFMAAAKWENTPTERWQDGDNFFLHTMPDLGLTRVRAVNDSYFSAAAGTHDSLFMQLFQNRNDHGQFTRKQLNHSGDWTDIIRGAPTLGLMAVIFTFKKPIGSLQVDELTNLGSLPPMVFFLPVMVPAGTDLKFPHDYDLSGKAIANPTISTYRIKLEQNSNILPYGQPYFLSTVAARGKAPDTLRSLSDVFRALWSKATQYSAWNMSFGADLHGENRIAKNDQPWDIMGQFCLDPMGQGRRIRGYNRYMGNYDLSDVNFMYEEGLGRGETTLKGWHTNGTLDRRPFLRQLRRSDRTFDPYDTVYVTPSFFGGDTTKNMIPLAMTVARFLYGTGTGLESFMNGALMKNTYPELCTPEPELSPSGTPLIVFPATPQVSKSFMDQMMEHSTLPKDEHNIGAIPVHRVPVDLVFDPEGNPKTFGLRISLDARGKMMQTTPGELDDHTVEGIKRGTEVMHNFNLAGAFGASSTKELTEVFKEVKSSSFKEGTKAKELFDSETAIDLFADVEEMV